MDDSQEIFRNFTEKRLGARTLAGFQEGGIDRAALAAVPRGSAGRDGTAQAPHLTVGARTRAVGTAQAPHPTVGARTRTVGTAQAPHPTDGARTRAVGTAQAPHPTDGAPSRVQSPIPSPIVRSHRSISPSHSCGTGAPLSSASRNRKRTRVPTRVHGHRSNNPIKPARYGFRNT